MEIIGRQKRTIKVVTIFNTARRFGRWTERKRTIGKERWGTELGRGRCGHRINSYQWGSRLHSFATFTVGKVLSEGTFILIKMATTLTFVTTRCFGGRHDDREIVNGEREGLDMNGEERARTDKDRGEREREREEWKKWAMRSERAQLAHDRQRYQEISKINGKKEEKYI